ncbi:hypothetical protein MPH_08122 [Macrophomina phaseolina MS6]|uniref:Uncharacterized protein n=1 Tax=Macrophomina phaseolina (strain MS6) TaxID=1126212 RepID=K2RWT6_MACPH|nr:hypothetical protein MPH_08122 [Macrophomina phaseolina MS6]
MQSSSAFAASKASLEPEKCSIDIEAAIGILQELKKTASPEQLVALHKALLPTRDEPAPIDTNNQAPPPKLVRRKSMAVPGLATRNPFDVLRKQDDAPPVARSASPVEEESHPWKPEQLGPLPLAQVASLEVPQDDRTDHRAQTPGDMDYATLSNKIGTLMITNGAPSPAPSIISRRLERKGSLPELRQDDYLSVGTGDVDYTEDGPLNFPPPRRFQTFGPSSGYAELDASSTEIPRMMRRSRVPSELMLNQVLDQTTSDDDSVRRPTRKLSKLSAEEYIAELQNSPYGESPFSRATPSPRPPEGDVYDDTHAHYSSAKYRAEALRILDGNLVAVALDYDDKIPVEQPSGAVPNTGFKKSLANGKLQRPAQAPHSDSGYSSGASLKAVRCSKPQAGEEDRTAAYSTPKEDTHSTEASQALPSAPDSRQHSRTVDERADAAAVQSSYAITGLPTVPASIPEDDKENKNTATKQNTTTEVKAETKAETKAEWRKSLRRSKSWKRLSLKGLTSPSSSPSPTPGTPEPTESNELGSEPPKPMRHDSAIEQKTSEKNESQPTRKKLQKRKSTAGSPTVQNIKPIETGSIPDVPSELSAGFSKRIEDSPGMDHLEHTCVSQSSLVEQSCVSIRFPSPAPAEEEDVRDTVPSLPEQNSKMKRSSKSARSPSPLKYALSFRRKSKGVSTREGESDKSSREATPTPPPKSFPQEVEVDLGMPTISDFGTVAQSLGGSPYDIALSSLPNRPQVSASSVVQPHHFSTNIIAPTKSGKNMDAATASEYARVRSKGRAHASRKKPDDIQRQKEEYRQKKEYRQREEQREQERQRQDEEQRKQEEQRQEPEHDSLQFVLYNPKSHSRSRPVSYQDQSHQQKQLEQEHQRTASGSSVRNFSRPQSVVVAPSSTGYDSNNSSMTDLGNTNKPLPPDPSKNTDRPAYRPYRRGLLIKSFSQSTAPRLNRAATYDIREEKIPAGEEDEQDMPKMGIERRHTEDLRPHTAEEKMVVELEEDLALADAKSKEQKKERELPPSLRIQTQNWEQASSFWRERRDAFRSQSQSQLPSQEERQLPRSLSVQYPRAQEQEHGQPERMKIHVRSQSQQATERPQFLSAHSYSQSSSATSSARASPAISPAWSPVPQEIPSPDKQLPNPFAAASAATRTKKRSSIQRYYSTKAKSNPLQNAKISVESVAEE